MSKDIAKNVNSPRDWFGQALVTLADKHEFLYVDMDVAGGTGGHYLRGAHPDRVIQCGISEQAAAGIAAGLATEQSVIYSTFATFGAKAWDVLRLQAFYNDLPVIICLSHLGLDVGPDSVSGASYEHYALWRSIPGNCPIFHPTYPTEMEAALEYLLQQAGPGVLFTGRSEVALGDWHRNSVVGDITKIWSPYSGGNDAFIFSTGYMVNTCVEAAKELPVTVYAVPCLQPVDDHVIQGVGETGKPIITVEDHGPVGGLYDIVAGILAGGYSNPIKQVCVREWGQSGSPDKLKKHYGLDITSIRGQIK